MDFTEVDFELITEDLYQFNRVFSRLWGRARPIWSEKIPKAAVTFTRDGGHLNFLLNKEFWCSIDHHTRLFVVCHEILHILQNYGLRVQGLIPDICNQAADVSINHAIINNFGFDRSKVMDWEKYCWVDTIWPDERVNNDEALEFYYHKMIENTNFISMELVDSHEGLSGIPEEFVRDILKELNSSEMDELKEAKSIEPGLEKGSQVYEFEGVQNYSEAWKKVLKLVDESRDTFLDTSYVTQKRRNRLLPKDLMLPGEYEIRRVQKNKLNIVMYLDCSASCIHWKEKFFELSQTLDPIKYNVKLYGFATTVSPFVKTGNKWAISDVGGGTSFSEVNNHFNLIKTPMPKHPVVIIVTDGYGSNLRPVKAEKWICLLTGGGSTMSLDKAIKVYPISEILPNLKT